MFQPSASFTEANNMLIINKLQLQRVTKEVTATLMLQVQNLQTPQIFSEGFN